MEGTINWLINSEDYQFFLYFSLLFILMIVEGIAYFRKSKRGKRWKANFFLTLLAIISIMIIPVTFISAATIAENNGWGVFNLVQWNWILVGFLTLFLRGFISFITHYLSHKVPLFWLVHRVHHLDTEMDVSTTVRFHPFEFIINVIIGVPIIFLFGFPVWALMLYELLDVAITLISHSNISFPEKIEKAVRYILVTPDLHRIHHSSYQPETDSNFGAVFPIWDILFGTFRTNTRIAPKEMEIGLEEVRDERTNQVAWLLTSPFRSFKKNKIKSRRFNLTPQKLGPKEEPLK